MDRGTATVSKDISAVNSQVFTNALYKPQTDPLIIKEAILIDYFTQQLNFAPMIQLPVEWEEKFLPNFTENL